MWKNIVERGIPQMLIWRMRIACCIPEAKNTLRLCNTHFLLHGWVDERCSMLRYTYIACLVLF